MTDTSKLNLDLVKQESFSDFQKVWDNKIDLNKITGIQCTFCDTAISPRSTICVTKKIDRQTISESNPGETFERPIDFSCSQCATNIRSTTSSPRDKFEPSTPRVKTRSPRVIPLLRRFSLDNDDNRELSKSRKRSSSLSKKSYSSSKDNNNSDDSS